MSDTMKVQPFSVLLRWILKEYETRHSIFGIPASQFYAPQQGSPFVTRDLFGQTLDTPIGPAAGPHTQLTQNILSAWLCGARFIELKTVQVMDELEIPRPCIDMEDEGYNVEWSQELKLDQSVNEYIKAWALIPILNRLLGYKAEGTRDTIFNMSVGYNFAGITSAPMLRFMERLADASAEIGQIRETLQKSFPQFADVEIPNCLTNNVTLSTMHGCPPDEIEKIAAYLLTERHLHTTVKLNPTLLGKEQVLDILNRQLGYDYIAIPDAVFEHDLRYERAVALVHSLQQTAAQQNLSFGVKLSNTLPNSNGRGVLPGGEMYMSGRALYPITMSLFHKLDVEFKGDLKVSYSAGADALNVTTLLSCGALPVTVASDLLKPGGYARLGQYLENIAADMRRRGAGSLAELSKDRSAAIAKAASEALENPRYKKDYAPYGLPKVSSALELLDCVAAPCMEPCAVHQDVPAYTWLIAQGKYGQALEGILSRNPLPGVTGYVCTQLCQTRCTRNNYEEPVAIRALKRLAAEKGQVALPSKTLTGRRVAVIGSGPAGLSAACFLALNGLRVTIFEAKDVAGGMLRLIPSFRLSAAIIDEDIARITGMGVEIQTSHPVTQPPEALLQQGFDAVFVAAGYQKDVPLDIPGAEGQGVYPALDVLEKVRRGQPVELGQKVVVIGGGDTAMDAVRVAGRLTGQPAAILYRRTKNEMPASPEERQGAFEEGARLEELVSPVQVILKDGKVTALECVRNELGEPDASGRRRPVPVAGSEFRIDVDSVIVATGQGHDLGFLAGSVITRNKNGSVAVEPASGRAGARGLFAGGDVVDGPESIIAACADGRRAAEGICAELGISFQPLTVEMPALSAEDILQVKRARARKEIQHQPEMLPVDRRRGFELIDHTLSEESGRAEALRCLQCATLCDKCVEVCPNRANYAYTAEVVDWALPTIACHQEQAVTVGEEHFRITQPRQVLHVDDFCNECGNCATFCTHQGKPYQDKPRLFLKESDFELEDDNAFWIARREQGWSIRRRADGKTARLMIKADDGEVYYDDEFLAATLAVEDFHLKKVELKRIFPGEASLKSAAEMYVILKGALASMPFLPAFAEE